DLLTCWLLTGETSESTPLQAHIGILVPEATLTGKDNQPGTTSDGTTAIHAPHIRALINNAAQDPDSDLRWFDLTTADPAETGGSAGEPAHGHNILAITSHGRFPPPRLRAALQLRDGTCQAPGCLVPAANCDIDHITPWPQGKTHADNLQALCRRHHRLKTAGHPIHHSRTEPDPPD
ncbi:HNH endonuclease signature motif containing protein, partial [Nesterenkonia sp.]|uniref:HNH endonuclease signature motif containing protein n=1 Tax=Nesterenkonia sp. TaxID=704201 RepID=UPI00262DC595